MSDVRELTPGRLSLPKRVLRAAKRLGLVRIARWNSATSRRAAAAAHRFQYLVEWGVDSPEWFDHYLDQFYFWHRNRNALTWERGVASAFALQASTTVAHPRVLELCSGDGFNTYHFYSLLAKSIIAIDFDPDAVRFAKTHHQAPNIDFRLADIRHDLPEGEFDNVIWDASIQHFTDGETISLMSNICALLGSSGILSGCTVADNGTGEKQLRYHEREFKGREDLSEFFARWFKNVEVWETVYPGRRNLYFYASNGALPRDRGMTTVLNAQ